jgi:hypothetical protein
MSWLRPELHGEMAKKRELNFEADPCDLGYPIFEKKLNHVNHFSAPPERSNVGIFTSLIPRCINK